MGNYNILLNNSNNDSSNESPNPPEFKLNRYYKQTNLKQAILNELNIPLYNNKYNQITVNNNIQEYNTQQEIKTNNDIINNSQYTCYDSDISDEHLETTGGSLMSDIRYVYKFKKEVLGEGQFGKVRIGYKKNDILSKRKYAIKSIHKNKYNKSELENIIKEVEILSSLDHPNIIQFYETYQDEVYFHLIMELCRGHSLLYKLKEHGGKLEEKETEIIILKILHAISYCHSKGIIHRDIKPENILFESKKSDEIKLIDFGLSKKVLNHQKMHSILGTSYYIAPEVLYGNYDEKCDIWSIGALTYLLLTGTPPFKGMSNTDIFKKILNGNINKIFDNVNLSDKAKGFISQCLKRNPSQRPSAKDILNDAWFQHILTIPLYLDKSVLINIKHIKPCCILKKYVLKYFFSIMNSNELKNLRKIFYALDTDYNGLISQNELTEGFNKLGIELYPNEIKNIFSFSDDIKKTYLSYSEFIILCFDSKHNITKERLKQAFNYFDINCSHYIEHDDIKDTFLRFGKVLTHYDNIYKIIHEVSHNLDYISFDKFISLFI